MKKIVIAILVTTVILGVFYFKRGMNFNEAVPDSPEITSIEIIRTSDNQDVVLEGGNDVRDLMNQLSETELREKSIGSIDFEESYWITIRADNNRKFGLTIYDEKYMLIYDYESSKQNSYQIISGFESFSIEKYFD